jgi:hypothetical protein
MNGFKIALLAILGVGTIIGLGRAIDKNDAALTLGTVLANGVILWLAVMA